MNLRRLNANLITRRETAPFQVRVQYGVFRASGVRNYSEIVTGVLVASAYVIDLLHDPLSPLNRGRNQLVSPWIPLRTSEEIISALHVQ
jgi:hypothetical protein